MTQAETLIQNLESRGVKLSVGDGKLKINAPTGEISKERLEQLRQHKAEIISRLNQSYESELKAEREAIQYFDGQLSEVTAQFYAVLYLSPETINLINQRAKEQDAHGRATANKFKWTNASIF